MRNQAEIKLGLASTPVTQATSGLSPGSTSGPPSKRTRSRASNPTTLKVHYDRQLGNSNVNNAIVLSGDQTPGANPSSPPTTITISDSASASSAREGGPSEDESVQAPSPGAPIPNDEGERPNAAPVFIPLDPNAPVVNAPVVHVDQYVDPDDYRNRKPQITIFHYTSSDETAAPAPTGAPVISTGVSTEQPRPILKKARLEKPETVRVSLDDGTVRDVSLELYERMKNVARDFAESAIVPSDLQVPGGVGRGAGGVPNISDGSLVTRAPALIPVTLPGSSSLPFSFSQAFPGTSGEQARRTGQDRASLASSSKGASKPVTHGGASLVDPKGGARSKTTDHRSGVNLQAPEVVGESMDYDEEAEDDTFAPGEGGYSDDEDDEEDGADAFTAEDSDSRGPESGAPTEDRVDFRGVVHRIRKTCGLPEVFNTPANNRVGYEKAIRPGQTPRASILLPWSVSLLQKSAKASTALEKGKLDSNRGARLFRPPHPAHMRFYRPEGSNAGPADLSQTLAEYLNEELDSLRRIATSYNPNETRDMSTMVANATAALSWVELALQALAPYQSTVQGEQATQQDHHLICISRAVGFVMENLVAMWANMELKRRDSILEKIKNKESKSTRKALRNGPLFQDGLFNDARVQEIHDRTIARLRESLILNATRPQHQRQPQAQQNSSGRRQGHHQPTRAHATESTSDSSASRSNSREANQQRQGGNRNQGNGGGNNRRHNGRKGAGGKKKGGINKKQ